MSELKFKIAKDVKGDVIEFHYSDIQEIIRRQLWKCGFVVSEHSIELGQINTNSETGFAPLSPKDTRARIRIEYLGIREIEET